MLKIFLSVSALLFFSPVSFSQDIDVLHYTFTINLNDNSDTVDCSATIQFVNKKKRAEIFFDLANVNTTGKGMMVESVMEENPERRRLQFRHEQDKLFITLNNNLSKDTGQLRIFYKGIPSDGLIISKNKYGERTFFSDNWPNRAHYWIPCNDRPDDKASFEFVVTAPSQYKVISNGVMVEERASAKGKITTHWKEGTPLPSKVMVIGAAKFAVKQYADSPSNIPVTAWIFQQDSSKGFHDYAPAPEILKFFSNYIAPYPYNKLANVQSKTIFGGMENASAIFYSENSVTGRGGVEDLLAHEIAHQWFGDMASEKTFAHLWLSEGFATYLTNIYLEKKYGKETLLNRMKEDRQQVIRFMRTHSGPVVDSISPLMDLLNANSYQKGGWVLHMLRNEVGDSAFHRTIQTYYQRYKGSNADTRDFEAVAEEVSGKDLKWFFDQWLYRPGIPQLVIDRNIDKDGVKLKIRQEGPKFNFPLEIAIVRTDGSTLKQTIDVHDDTVEFKMKLSGVKTVVIDPETKLLYTEVRK